MGKIKKFLIKFPPEGYILTTDFKILSGGRKHEVKVLHNSNGNYATFWTKSKGLWI